MNGSTRGGVEAGAGRRRGLVMGVAIAMLALSACVDGRSDVESTPRVYRVPVTGVIELGVAPFVERSLREAEAAGAAAVVLELETPGGRVDAAQRIVSSIQDAEIPVYAFVNDRALSAGAMIALATDEVFMSPGAIMGAATPVTGEGEKAPEKIVSAMRSEMRALAQRRGLDPAIAEAMVDEEVEVEGVVERGKLLTFTTAEASEVGFSRPAADLEDVLEQVGAPHQVVAMEVNWAEGVVRFITHPMVAPFLLSIGFLGLLMEIKTPAFGVAGLAGAGALALFFGGHYLVGLAGWEEVLILTAGLVFLGIEAFVVPGFGVFGLLGIAGVLGSIYLSLVGNLSTLTDYNQAAMIVAATMLIVLVSAWVIVRTLPKNRRLLRSGILLGEDTGRDIGYLSAAVRAELVGRKGTAITDLRPAGVGRFDDERVDVVAEEGWLTSGTPIQVVRAEGYRHVVRAVEAARDDTGGTADTAPPVGNDAPAGNASAES
ncbi:MAG TPA: NfeD family protein [Longimicrobiales bacterium]|nr:NfeD family protein [Longimicrobiales bacterium]